MANVLESLSEAMASAVEIAGKSVVRVEGRRRLPASGIAWSAEGVIVTAHHVVEHDENIGVGLPDGGTATATLVGRDPTTDLAVLRVSGARLEAPAWIEPESLRVGSLALALGRPGRTVQATLGVISALGDSWRTPGGGAIDRYLQTDVVMYPGFSGGPLIGPDGQVIGLNTSAMLRGVSLAIPAPTIRSVVEALLAHGHIRRGYLGVGAQPARLPEKLQRETGQETGLLLVSVEPGSPADKGGLLMGDVIITLAGEPTRHSDDLLAQLSGDRIGEPVVVKILRGGKLQELSVTINERE
jgi:S1-C subfamily serine protease